MAKDHNRKNKRRCRKFVKKYDALIGLTMRKVQTNTFTDADPSFDDIRNMMAQEIQGRGLMFEPRRSKKKLRGLNESTRHNLDRQNVGGVG